MRDRRNASVRRLTAAALLSALGTVLLFLGSLFGVLDLSMAALASLTVLFAVLELGKRYALPVYLVTGTISLFLLPAKTPALFYLLFFGYYPILKEILEGHFKKPIAWLIKLLLAAACFLAGVFVAVNFLTPDPDSLFRWGYLAVLLVLPVFWLYDVALSRLLSAYLYRWREKWHLPKF